MKRSWIKRKTTKPLKRTVLRVAGVSSVSSIKREIQALLRTLVTIRDGGCLFRDISETGNCSGPLQAEHLITRARSVTYADPRNIICLCQRHHIFWKPQHSRRYWEIVRDLIGEERWSWYTRAEMDNKPYHFGLSDWKIAKAWLQSEIKLLQK